MPSVSRLIAIVIALSALSAARAGVIDLGNIASDGSGGRQMVVRPMAADDVTGWPWRFFNGPIPGVTDEPTPATPAQESYHLVENTSLILAIPQLQHFPAGADVAVSYSVSGNELTVDANLNFLGYFTHTIYGPHEYLLPIAGLSAGQYHLNFNLTNTGIGATIDDRATGYVDFTVHAVPEPTGPAIVLCLGLIYGFGAHMRRA